MASAPLSIPQTNGTPQTHGTPQIVPQPTPDTGVTIAAPTTQKTGTPGALVDREPVSTTATIVGVLSALVSWAVARNYVGESDEALFQAIIPMISAVVFGYYGRRGATSVGRAQIAIDNAYSAQPGLDPKPVL